MRKIWLIPLELSGILIAILIIGAAGAIFGIYQFNKKPKPVSKLKTEYVVTADELFDAFDKDESTASQKYIDKVVEVEGKLVESGRNEEGKLSFVLEAENALLGGINAAMGEGPELSYKNGDNIKLKCLCIGFNMEVILNNCLIIHE